MNKKVHIGTCSWKYDSWQGIVYPEQKPFNHLQEYSKQYKTVEVDQWFWSLFSGSTPVLPKPSIVREYANSVPADFTFAIKVPNSITLTHHYKKRKTDPLTANPHFLSVDLMNSFLERIEVLSGNMGPLMFQFEYLNKQKMPGGLTQFIEQVGEFIDLLPADFTYCIECRNPNYLNKAYFDFLGNSVLHHVFLQGYYMPSIFDLYSTYKEHIRDTAVIRLHGPDRKGIEQQTGKDWSQIVSPKDKDLSALAEMLNGLKSQGVDSFVFVNNHFEGSAPRTITKIEKLL